MWLLVDIGNTRIKWRWFDDEGLRAGGTEALPSPGHESVVFSRIWEAASKPVLILVSNVAGDRFRDALDVWSRERWECSPVFVTSVPRQCGVTNGYDEPVRLGVDRWCSLIGARALVSSGEVCVVDCGTAITLDVLAADGVHRGGLIAPGLRTMVHSLTATALGPRADVAPAPYSPALGRTTSDCIRSGILAAAAGMVEHTLEKLAFPPDAVVLLTGGDAAFLASALVRQVRIEPDVLFYGLARMGVPGGAPCVG
jgi:type III pantothenate kinase